MPRREQISARTPAPERASRTHVSPETSSPDPLEGLEISISAEERAELEALYAPTSPVAKTILEGFAKAKQQALRMRAALILMTFQGAAGVMSSSPRITQEEARAETRYRVGLREAPAIRGIEQYGYSQESMRQLLSTLPAGWGSRANIQEILALNRAEHLEEGEMGMTSEQEVSGSHFGGHGHDPSRIEMYRGAEVPSPTEREIVSELRARHIVLSSDRPEERAPQLQRAAQVMDFATANRLVSSREFRYSRPEWVESTRAFVGTFIHEVHHANDPMTVGALVPEQRERMQRRMEARLTAPDRMRIPYVEAISGEETEQVRMTKTKEYFAELGRIIYQFAPRETGLSEEQFVGGLVERLRFEFPRYDARGINMANPHRDVQLYLEYVRMTDPGFEIQTQVRRFDQIVEQMRTEHRAQALRGAVEGIRNQGERLLLSPLLRPNLAAREVSSDALAEVTSHIPSLLAPAFQEWKQMVDTLHDYTLRRDSSLDRLHAVIHQGMQAFESRLPSRPQDAELQAFNRARARYMRLLVGE